MQSDTERTTRVRIFCPRRENHAGRQDRPYQVGRCGYMERADLTRRELDARLAESCPSCHRVGLDAVEER